MWKENAEDVVTPQTLKRMPQLITKFITGDQQMGASYSVWVLRNNQGKIDIVVQFSLSLLGPLVGWPLVTELHI